jgi:uncharacterized protein YlxP (DUF503 family)
MTTKTNFTNDLLTKQLLKLKEDALKPMSIIELKEKFNLSFPFKVNRIKFSYSDKHPQVFMGVTTVTEIRLSSDKGLRTNNQFIENGKCWSQCANVQDYILYEEN